MIADGGGFGYKMAVEGEVGREPAEKGGLSCKRGMSANELEEVDATCFGKLWVDTLSPSLISPNSPRV